MRVFTAMLAIGLVSGCSPAEIRYDFDADGTEDAADCGPSDPSVWPGAPDPYGDQVDSDCDGFDGVDGDGDGYPAAPEEDAPPDIAWDCDDARDEVHPGASDQAGDGLDSNCDGHDGTDLDGDGHASQASGGADCDDALEDVYPSASDPFGDSTDSSCDGLDGTDADGDDFPVFDPDYTGDLPSWDCDDSDALVHPGAGDAAGDGVDSDCD